MKDRIETRPCANPECDWLTMAFQQWQQFPAAQRREFTRGAHIRRRQGQGLCTACWAQAQNGVDAPARVQQQGRLLAEQVERDREVMLEDFDFMVRNGETFDGAARRLGMSPATLERAVLRARERGDSRAVDYLDRVAA